MAGDPSSDGSARGRILEAAWDLIVDRGLSAASVAEIAKTAEVSRQAVYLHFGSRAGLFVAMVRHHDEKSPLVARLRALRKKSPADVRLFEDYFSLWLDYVPEVFPVARVLSAAAATDPEAALAWNDRMEGIRAAVGRVMERMQEAALLREEWSVGAATDWAWSQSHIDVWRHLVVERGWSPEDAKAQIIAALRIVLLNDRELSITESTKTEL